MTKFLISLIVTPIVFIRFLRDVQDLTNFTTLTNLTTRKTVNTLFYWPPSIFELLSLNKYNTKYSVILATTIIASKALS